MTLQFLCFLRCVTWLISSFGVTVFFFEQFSGAYFFLAKFRGGLSFRRTFVQEVGSLCTMCSRRICCLAGFTTGSDFSSLHSSALQSECFSF